MAVPVAIKGKNKIISHFKNSGHPFWRVYPTSDPRSLISYNFTIEKLDKSLAVLQDVIDNIDPAGIYSLETFEKADDKKYSKPDTSISFCLETESAVVTGTGILQPAQQKEMFSPASLKDQLELVKENARLQIECSIYKDKYEQSVKKIAELEVEITELEDELDELEGEEEEEENELAKLAGDPMKNAFANLIKEHGGVIIERFAGGKLKDDAEIDPTKVAGIPPINMPDIETILQRLHAKDEQLQYHLYKLMQIAEQRPATFKVLIGKLETY